MKNGVYSVYDTKSGTLVGPLEQALNHAVAERRFYDIIEGNENLSRHRADFELRFLGYVDVMTGLLEPVGHDFIIAHGASVGAK